MLNIGGGGGGEANVDSCECRKYAATSNPVLSGNAFRSPESWTKTGDEEVVDNGASSRSSCWTVEARRTEGKWVMLVGRD